jgi:hypothetical protein
VICSFKTSEHFTAIWNRYAKEVSSKKTTTETTWDYYNVYTVCIIITTLLAKCNSMTLLLNIKYSV